MTPMQLASSVDERASLLDTKPSLLFALDCLLKGVDERQKAIIRNSSTVSSLLDKCQNEINSFSLVFPPSDGTQTSEDLANTYLSLFMDEFRRVLDDGEALAFSLNGKRTEIIQEWFPQFSMLLYLAIVEVCNNSKDSTIQARKLLSNIVLQKLIPASTTLWLALNEVDSQSMVVSSELDWLQNCWELMLSCEDAINGKSLGMMIAALARLLRIYFPWSSNELVNYPLFEHFSYDVRGDSAFVALIKEGLSSNDGAIRKQSLFILKQTVRFSRVYFYATEEQTADAAEFLFLWRPEQADGWVKLWQEFFLLYESVQETQVHLIQPMLPLLRKLLQPGPISLPFEWWQLIVERAVLGDGAHICNIILEAVLSINIEEYPVLLEQTRFFFGFMMQSLDNTSLFTKSSGDKTASHLSAFGMKLANFYSKYISCLREQQESIKQYDAILLFIQKLRENVKTATPMLFFAQSLLLLAPAPILSRDVIEQLKALSRSHTLFHNLKSRKLIRWQLLHIFLNLADPRALSFADVASALCEFTRVRPETFNLGSEDFSMVVTWLNDNFDQNYIDQNVMLAVEQFFDASPASTSLSLCIAKSEEISTMLCFTLAKEGGFAQCIRPLYQRMATMALMSVDVSFIVRTILLFCQVDDALKAVSQNQSGLLSNFSVSARLYDWIAAIVGTLRENHHQISSLQEVKILMRGLRLFIEKAKECPSDLIAYLDIQLYKMVGYLQTFDDMVMNESAEDYEVQLLKYVCFDFMDVSFKTLEEIGSFHVAFIHQHTLSQMFRTDLVKPPVMTDTQIDDWNDLVIAFTISKWSLIATIAHFAHQSPKLSIAIDMAFIFKKCIDALAVAQYQSIVAIYKCLKILAAIPSDSIPVELFEDAFATSKTLLEDYNGSPSWFFLYAEGFIEFFVQPTILGRSDITDGMDSLMGRVLLYVISNLGSQRKNVVAKLSRTLFECWTANGFICTTQIHEFLPIVKELLLYGPIRDENEDRLAQNLTINNVVTGGTYSRESQAQFTESFAVGTDHMARVCMHSLLLEMDPTDKAVQFFASSLLDELLSIN